MDSRKFKTERSSDLDFQRKCYYHPRGSHFITFSVITEISGDIVWYSDFSPSISASFGDGAISGFLLFRDLIEAEESDHLASGITNVLSGSHNW